jgi:hypothetical protein
MIPLIRRWAVDWLASHDPDTCTEIMRDDYLLSIGAIELQGREAYVEGTMGQLAIFPGLVLTVHEVIATETHGAVRFTEHGAGTHKDGRHAAWGGIAIFETDGSHLVRTWAEEDYLSRSRQLGGGSPDVIEPPAIAPWDTPVLSSDHGSERTVSDWIAAGLPTAHGVVFNDGWLHPEDDSSIDQLAVDVLFSAGSRVAFHGRHVTEDGFSMGVSGLVAVDPYGKISGRVVSDRLGARAHTRSRQRAIA